MSLHGKIRAGMVGGGPGAFIGAVHRMAAALDGEIELVCGSFSSDAGKSAEFGRALRLDPRRVYPSFQALLEQEARWPQLQRMQFVIIATPNHLHHPIAAAALAAGFHVLCEKPVTLDLPQARQLHEITRRTGRLLAVTYTYCGYPMVKQAREVIASGRLGRIRNVQVEYLQGWLSRPVERTNSQALWRVDPERAGAGGALGDIGVHAFHLAEYVTRLHVSKVCADLATFGEGRRLDDDGRVLVRFDSGARGQIVFSQVCAGELNGLRIRVYGEEGGLDWDHRRPERLVLRWLDESSQILLVGQPEALTARTAYVRLPGGYPEGYIEALANLYRTLARAIRSIDDGEAVSYQSIDLPSIDDAVRGMAFIESAIESDRSAAKWVSLTC